jgi:hypothetical protein
MTLSWADKKILSQTRMEKAREFLEDAKGNFREGRVKISINRSYYALPAEMIPSCRFSHPFTSSISDVLKSSGASITIFGIQDLRMLRITGLLQRPGFANLPCPSYV